MHIPMDASMLCSNCKQDNLIADLESGEMVCRSCGLVDQEKMQETKTMYYDKDADTRGTELSSLASHDMGLSTNIGMRDTDAKGQKIHPSIHSDIQRLRTWDHRIQIRSSKERNLKLAFNVLQTLKDKFNLSETTIETAAYIYRKALTKGLTRGRSIDSVIVGAAYIAIGETQSPISLNVISQTSNIRSKTIARIVRLLASQLDIMIPIADPSMCVSKVGNIAGLSERTKREAVKIMSQIKNTQYATGKNPMGLAAATLYIASSKTSEQISQEEIAKAANVTEVTIRTRLKDIKAKNLVRE